MEHAIYLIFTLLMTGVFIVYREFYYTLERVNAVINKFYPSQPDSSEVISIDITFSNNGNKDVIISKVSLAIPVKNGSDMCFPAQEEDQSMKDFNIPIGKLIKKSFIFQPKKSLSTIFIDANYIWANTIGLKLNFDVINSTGKTVKTSYDGLSIGLDEKRERIVSGTMRGINPREQFFFESMSGTEPHIKLLCSNKLIKIINWLKNLLSRQNFNYIKAKSQLLYTNLKSGSFKNR